MPENELASRRVFGKAAALATYLALTVLASGYAQLRPPRLEPHTYPVALEYDAKQIRIEKVELAGRSYIRLRHPAMVLSTRELGRPALPQVEVLVVLPPDAINVRVSVHAGGSATVARGARVVPLQPPMQTSIPRFSQGGLPLDAFFPTPAVVVDEKTYASKAPYPRAVATLEEVATRYGAKVAMIRISPLVFFPREQRTALRTSLKGTVTFDSHLPTRDLYPALPMPLRESLIRTVINPKAIALTSLSAAVAPLSAHADYVVPDIRPARHDTVSYVVITRAALVASFQPLVDWKIHKGADARLVTVEWIESRYPGVDLANKIRNFVLDATAKWGASWILLGGDVKQVPARLGLFDSYVSSYGPTDLYFSGLGTNWNANGNHVFGESGEEDLNPDVFVGRASVENTAQAAVFVNKVLVYEKNPPAGYGDSALLMGASFDLGGDSSKEWSIKPLIPLGNLKRMYDPPSSLRPDFVWNQSNTITQVNQGYHILNHMDHCGINGMGTGSKAGGGGIGNADVDALTNGLPGSILWTYGCDPNAFDYDSISEHWMRNPNGGAVAFVGNTRTGYASQTSQDSQFFKAWFTDKLRHLGAIFSTTQGGAFGSYESANMNLLGDPEMVVWNTPPTPLTLAGLGAITTGPNPLNLTVGGLAAGEEATLTFRDSGGLVYEGGQTVSGTLTGTLVAHTASTLDLVVTSPDRRALTVSVPVGASSGAHLYVSGLQVIDTALGNGNQQLESGESAIVRITVSNGGGAASAAGAATLATTTTGVTISSPVQPLPVLATGGTQTIDFPVSLSHVFTDGDAILFDLTTSAAAVEQTDIHVPVFAPILEQTHVYDDSAGNGNGVPEAGEAVTFGLHVINNGFGDAYGVTATLTPNGPGVTITGGMVTVGNVLAKSDANSAATFALTLDTAFNPSVDTVTLTMTDSLGNTWTQNIKLVVPAPPTGMTYRSTASSITALWDAAAVSERNYRIYRSDVAPGPYDEIETFLVRDGALYEDAAINPSNPSYFYRVAIIDAFGNESAPAQVQAWTSLSAVTGFPRSILPADEAIIGHTVAFDIYGDGKKEIFATTGSPGTAGGPGVLYAWKADGSPLILIPGGNPNFAQFAALDGRNFGAPAFADIDNDGHVDIIVNGEHKVFAFKADGTPVAGWAGGVAIPSTCVGGPPTVANSSPAVGDLDGDGLLEVVVTAFDGGNSCGDDAHVYVIDHTGVIKATYTMPHANYSFATPALADLNGDGKLEAVIPATTGAIFVLDTAASSFVSIAAFPRAIFFNEASLVDLDGDGKLDIIAASQGDDRVYAVHLDGSPVAGWAGGRPLDVGDHIVSSYGYGSAIAVGDVDCDGRPEVALGTEQHVYLWGNDGVLKTGWPVNRENKTGNSSSAASPLIVDVNGDGQLDIVIGSSSLADGGLIYAWDGRTGVPISGFPQAISDVIWRTGAVADLDGDGLLEVVQGAGLQMYAFKTNGRALDAFTPWASIDRNAVHTSAFLAADLRAACCIPPPAGIVAWWPFNETAGTTAADIAGGHDGTYQNGPVPTAGMVGQALSFDGVASYVSVPDAPALNLSGGQFTLDFWIYPNATETQGTIYRKGMLAGSSSLLLSSAGFHLFYSNGHFFGFLGGTSSGLQLDFSPNLTDHAAPGTWTFVALTVDLPAGAANLYINGHLAQSNPLPTGLGSLANTAPVIIGGTNVAPSASRSFAGALDELELENRVLTPQEVQKIYAAGPAGKCGSVHCLGAMTLQLGSGDGYAAFHPDEAGAIFSCTPGFGGSNLDGIRFDPPGPLPAANLNCSTTLYVFDQAGTRRQALGVHLAPGNTCPCTFPPAPGGACFYEPLCPPNDSAHITCSDLTSDSGVILSGGAPTRRITDFDLPNFPGLKVHLIQEAFMNRLDQTYQFINTSGITYNLRLSRVADIDVGYVDDGTASGTAVPSTGGYLHNIPGFVPFGAEIHDNVMTGSTSTPIGRVRVTAPQGGGIDAIFEGARLQGNGSSSHARAWWNYGVPPSELGVYGIDGNYWTVTWTGDPATPSESDQAITIQSLLTVPPGQTRTYVTQTFVP